MSSIVGGAGLLASSYRADLSPAEVDPAFITQSSCFISLPNGARIHVRDEGRRDGPPLVLVHGNYDSLLTWERWVARLRDEFRLISLDLPGHGLTGPVPDADYSDAAHVRTIHGIVQALGIERFALAGNSMGGSIAMQYALAHPNGLTSLVLLDSSGYPHPSWVPEQLHALVLSLLGHSLRYLVLPQLVAYAYEKTSLTPAGDALMDRTVRLLRRSGTRDVVWREELAPVSIPTERLAAIAIPTLILWGQRDEIVPVQDAYALHRAIPNSRLIVYSDVGHMPMYDVPDRSASDAASFLRAARAGDWQADLHRALRARSAPWRAQRTRLPHGNLTLRSPSFS